MSDTPRTDECLDGNGHGNAIEGLARQLERELAAMTAAKDRAVEGLKSAERSARSRGYPKTADAYAKLIAELEEVK